MTLLLFVSCLTYAEEITLIDIQKQNPKILTDLRYKTKENFVGEPLYPESARVFLREESAEALFKAQEALEKHGLA